MKGEGSQTEADRLGGSRYCGACGETFADADGVYCPNCGAAWSPFEFASVPSVAALLGELRRLREADLLDEASYERVRSHYQARLAALRAAPPATTREPPPGWPARPSRPGILRRILDPGAGTVGTAVRPSVGRSPPLVPSPPRTTLAEWAAARQADILLYLGAFLLSVAALIFVGYQGEALTGAMRFAVLLAYTLVMIGLGLALRRWERVREAGPVFLALGALLVPVNFIALRTQVLGDGALPDDVLVLLGALTTGGLYLLLAFRGYGTLYLLPAALAALVGWGALLSVLNVSFGWFGAWYAGGAAAVALVAEMRGPSWRRPAHLAIGLMAVAVAIAHVIALVPDAPAAQLPVAYCVCVVVAGVIAVRRRSPGAVAALPALGGMLGLTTLHALGVAVVWWSYPLLGAVLVVLATEPWWSRRPVLREIGWPYALAGAAVVPIQFTSWYADRPVHGAAGFAIAALVYLAASQRAHGSLVRLTRVPATERGLLLERLALVYAAGIFVGVAAAYANARLGIGGTDRAWVYAALGLVAWLGLTAAGRARRELFGILAPAAVLASVAAAVLAQDDPARAALLLALAAAGALTAFATTRRPSLLVVTAVFVAAALAFAWRWRGYDAPLLPVAYAAVAAVLTAALARRRRYSLDEAGWSVTVLSWTPWLLAVAAALVLLEQRDMALPLDAPLARTREWAVLTGVVGAAALAVALEAARLRRGWVAAVGSAGLLAALLLAIAIARPGNVQAYTLPAGIYLVGLGFAWRHSPALIERHLYAFELPMILGMAVAVLPAAAQALEPGGGRYGLELIAIGLLLLAVGLAVYARWLVVGGVLTLTGVAVRWLLTDSAVPYWLTLGLVGMALLGIGTLLLFERDRWDRTRARIRRWWATGAA